MSTASRVSDQAADATSGWRIGQAAIAAAGSGLPSSCLHAAARTLTGFQSATAWSQPGIAVVTMIYYASANLHWTWLWYVADPKAFGAELNRLIPGHPYPITLNATGKEPDWTTYRAMREKVH